MPIFGAFNPTRKTIFLGFNKEFFRKNVAFLFFHTYFGKFLFYIALQKTCFTIGS